MSSYNVLIIANKSTTKQLFTKHNMSSMSIIPIQSEFTHALMHNIINIVADQSISCTKTKTPKMTQYTR